MRDVRIQKVLAEQGVCSRRAAEQLIREGRVKLNGRPVTVGDKMDTLKDLLTVDGQKVYVPKKSEKYYYMMYKPRGYITTTNDERGWAQNGNGPDCGRARSGVPGGASGQGQRGAAAADE